METLFEYRHIVDKKTKKILMDAFKKVIKSFDMSNIGFVGILASHKKEYSHDIDVLIFPSENARIGESIISVIKLYEDLEKELRKSHERLYLSCSSRKILQEMSYYIASLQEGAAGLIPVHSLFFIDDKSFVALNPKDFQREIKKNMICLYGDFNIIKRRRNDISMSRLEPYFLILDFEMNSKLKTFPRHLVRTSAESLFSYLSSKYKIKLKRKRFHNIKEIESEIFNLLRELDKKIYK